MLEKGIALRIKKAGLEQEECLFWDEHSMYERCSPNDVENVQTAIPIIDVEFVDDAAFVFTAAVPSTLRRHLRSAISSLQRILQKYGMTINWDAGKTEAIVVFRGKRQGFEKESIQSVAGTRSLRVQLDTAAWLLDCNRSRLP